MRLLADMWSSEVVYRLGWALLHTLWLGLAAAVVLAGVLAALRRRSANARYAVACAALGVMAALPIAAYLVTPAPTRLPAADGVAPAAPTPVDATAPRHSTTLTDASEADARHIAPVNSTGAAAPATPDARAGRADPPAGPAGAATATTTNTPAETGEASLVDEAMRAVEPALPWIVAAWAVGAFALSLLHLCGWSLARRMTRLGVRPAGREITAIADELALAMGLPRPVEILESMRVAAPAVIGHLRPVILVPVALATGLTVEQLRAILAHELAHVRRWDYLVNLLQTLVETVLFYHPAAWYVSRRIRIEREHCCDDAALGAGAEGLSYAESLLHLAGRSAGMAGVPAAALAAGGQGGRSQLRCRIARLLGRADGTARVSRGWPIALAVMVALVAAIAVPLACEYAATPPAVPAVRPAADKGQAAEKAAGELVWADAKSGKVLFRGRDIVRFDPRRQVFLLRRNSAIDVEAWLCNRRSRGFVVRDQAGVIYPGRFIVDKQGRPYDGPTVLISDDGPEAPLFAVTGAYPRAAARHIKALRHPRLLAGLKAAGVLGTIDEDYRAMPLARRTAGWARQIPGLRMAANVYTGTFRIGRTGRVLLAFGKDGPFDLPGETVEIRTTVRNLYAAKFASVRTETLPRERFIEMIDAGAYIHEVRNWWGPARGAEGSRAKPGPAEVSVELVLREKVKDKPETTRPVKTISLFSVKLGILPDAAVARAGRASPAGDLAAVGNFLDHIVPRLGEKWKLSHVGYGQFTHSRPDRGFDITFYNENVPFVNGRRITVDTHVRIAGVGAELPDRRATELARWRGRRVFIWGGRKHWPDNDKDISAALAATASGSVAEPMPAGRALRTAGMFVAGLDPRIPEGWQWTSVGYNALGATHPRGWTEIPGHRGVQLRLDRPNRAWPTDASAGSARMSVTIMDPFYAGKPAKASPDGPTGRAVEIGRLGDRRVFADLRNVGHFWDGFVKEDLRAAVKAAADQRGPTGRGVTYLFKVGPTPRGPSDGGWSYDFEVSAPLRKAMLPLLRAAGQGDLAAVKKIIEARGELAKAKCPPSGSSYGTLGVWAALSSRWQSGWHVDFDGATALHFAADMGRTEVAAYLLERGAAVNEKDRLGQTPLHCVAVLGRPPGKGAHRPHKTLAEAVKERQAIIRRREVLAPLLLAKGADINATDREGDTPLAAAARADNPIIAKLLLARGAKLDIFSAIRLGLLDHVEAMLKIAPGCVNLAGGRDASPLHVAAGGGRTAAVKLLLRRGAKLGTGKHGETPLGRAVRGGHTEAVRILLAAGARPNRANCWSEPVLNYAARVGRLDIVKLLVARGAKLEAVDSDNCTALFDAAYAGQMEVAAFLLDKGADVNGGAEHGNSSLRGVTYLARQDREVDPSGGRLAKMKKMAAFLIARGAKVDVLSAAALGKLDRLRAIIKADPASVHVAGTDRNWSQPLTWAAGRKQLAAAKLLLDAGAKVNAPGPFDNSTALHHAAGAGDLEMCTLLLDRGANVHASTKQKHTPLHWAMSRDENAPVVKLLLDRGADAEVAKPIRALRTGMPASTGKDRSRRPRDPEKRYPANTGPVEIKTPFTRANPNYKQRVGAYYEKQNLAPAVGQIAQAAELGEQEKAVARAILRAFIYDRLDSAVRGGGKITEATLQKHLAVMDGRFGAELSKEKFDLYLVWRKGRATVGNSLLFLMAPGSAVRDKHKEIRAAAAGIRTKYPKGGQQMWKALAALVKPGMTIQQMKIVLPPAGRKRRASAPPRFFTITYPLDANFAVEASGKVTAVMQNDHMTISAAPIITKRPSERTRAAVKQLKADLLVHDFPHDFRLSLQYYGPSRGEVVSSLYFTTASVDIDPIAGVAYVWPSKERAVRIIEHLAKLAFFDRAKEVDPQKAPPAAGIPKGPTYVLMVPFFKNNKALCYYLDLGWDLQTLQFLDGFHKGLIGKEAKAMDKLLAQLERQRKEWKQANNEPNRPVVKLVPTHVACHSGLVLRAYDGQHGIVAVVPVPRKLHKALQLPVSGKQGEAIVSYYRGKRIDNLLAPGGSAIPPSGVGGTEYEKQEALSGSVTVTPLPGNTERQKVEVTFKDLAFKGFDIKKIGPLKVQIGLPPPP